MRYALECGLPAATLCPENIGSLDPAFYVCFGCQFVGQVGIGPVERHLEEGQE